MAPLVRAVGAVGAAGRGGLVTGGADIAAVPAAPAAAPAPAAPGAPAPGAVVGRWNGALGSVSFLARPSRSRQDCLGPRGGGGSQTGTPLSGRGRAASADVGEVGDPFPRAVAAAFGACPAAPPARPFGGGEAPVGGCPAAPGWVAAGRRAPLGAQLVTGPGRWPDCCCAGRGFADGCVRGAPGAAVRACVPFGCGRTGLAEGWVRGAPAPFAALFVPAVRVAPARVPASSSRFSRPLPFPLLPLPPRPFGVPF